MCFLDFLQFSCRQKKIQFHSTSLIQISRFVFNPNDSLYLHIISQVHGCYCKGGVHSPQILFFSTLNLCNLKAQQYYCLNIIHCLNIKGHSTSFYNSYRDLKHIICDLWTPPYRYILGLLFGTNVIFSFLRHGWWVFLVYYFRDSSVQCGDN